MFLVNTQKCAGCGLCVEACPRGAIQVIGGRARIDPVQCIGCGVCARVCPREAIRPVAPPIRVAYRPGRAPIPPLSQQLKELTAQTEALGEDPAAQRKRKGRRRRRIREECFKAHCSTPRIVYRGGALRLEREWCNRVTCPLEAEKDG